MKTESMVSVLMPAYNAEKYISESIESILNQTYANWELIILDDCSNDQTYEIACGYASSRIRIYRNSVNRGVVACRNILLSYAQGNFIAILDADDVALPARFEQQIQFFNQYPAYAFVATGVEYFGAQSDLYCKSMTHDELKVELFFYNPVCHSTVMFNRALISEGDLFYNYYGFLAEDYELLRRLISKYRGYLLGDLLVKYRVHSSSTSGKMDRMRAGEFFSLFTNVSQVGFDLDMSAVVLLFRAFFKKDIKASELSLVAAVFEHLLQKNSKLQIFNTSIFKQRIQACLQGFIGSQLINSDSFSPRLIPFFYNLSKNGFVTISFQAKARFYLKCILFHKV